MTKKVITFVNGSKHTVYYEAKDDNNVVRFTVGDKTVMSHSKTDSFGRKVFDELQLGTGFVSHEFSYCTGAVTQEHIEHEKGKSSPTTQLVSQIILSNGTTLSYGYDAEERITSVSEKYIKDDIETTHTVNYTYDALGQLLTETVNGADVNSMEYDNYGNDTKSMFIINLITIVLYNFFAALLMGCGVFYSLHTSMTIRAELRRSQARMQTVPIRKKPYTLTTASSKSKSRNMTQ